MSSNTENSYPVVFENLLKSLGFDDINSLTKFFEPLELTPYTCGSPYLNEYISEIDKYRLTRYESVMNLICEFAHIDKTKNSTFLEILNSLEPNSKERIDAEQKLDHWASNNKISFIDVNSKPYELLTTGLFKCLPSAKISEDVISFPLYSVGIKEGAFNNHDYTIFAVKRENGEKMVLRREMYIVKDTVLVNNAINAIRCINNILGIPQANDFSPDKFKHFVSRHNCFYKTDIRHAFASTSVREYFNLVKDENKNPLVMVCIRIIEEYYNRISDVYPETENFLPITPVSRFLFHSLLGIFIKDVSEDVMYVADDIVIGGSNAGKLKVCCDKLSSKMSKFGLNFGNVKFQSKAEENIYGFKLEFLGGEYRVLPNSDVYVSGHNYRLAPAEDKENDFKRNSLDIFI